MPTPQCPPPSDNAVASPAPILKPADRERQLEAAVRAYTEIVALDSIRAAYVALGTGDVEPLVSLMDEKMERAVRAVGV